MTHDTDTFTYETTVTNFGERVVWATRERTPWRACVESRAFHCMFALTLSATADDGNVLLSGWKRACYIEVGLEVVEGR
jgi:hypothetical protein